LRDELRTTSQTLAGLPVPEREAFVLREWLGFESSEAALALGMTVSEVDGLATRARRSLVIAVGGLEPAINCSGTRAALEAGSLDRAAKVHLLRCPVCRGVRRALRAPDASARPAVAQRLSAVIPGFATGGGGFLAALTAKAATGPVLAKTAAIVVAAVATGGAVEQAIVREQPARHAKAHGGQAQAAPAQVVTHPLSTRNDPLSTGSVSGERSAPPRVSHASAAAAFVRPATRGAAATPTRAHGSRTGGDDRGGHSSGSDDAGGGNSGPGNGGRGSRDETGSRSGGDDGGDSASGTGSSHHGAGSSGEGSGNAKRVDESGGQKSGSGKSSSGHHGGSGDAGESSSGSPAATTAPAAVAPEGDDASNSGKGSGDSGNSGDSGSGGSADTPGGDESQPAPIVSD
jgi:hypothetical protein